MPRYEKHGFCCSKVFKPEFLSAQFQFRIRPQNARERAAEEKICIFISQDEPQITIGRDKSFTYGFRIFYIFLKSN